MFWMAVHIVGLMLALFIAGVIGAIADAIVPGRLPGGLLGAVLVGIAGGFVGNLLMWLVGIRDAGPNLFGVHLVPTFIGAVVLAVAAELLSKSQAGRYME
jgi:uncharacterized membrane protein YeaQ/YmgE (transglycosylase-associated protein family)